MEAEGSGVEGFDDVSKKLEADNPDSSMESSLDQTAAVNNDHQAMLALDEVLKGLIISQIRGPFVQVQEGLVHLIKECVISDLIADDPFFTHAALSGYVDHFQSVDAEDLGWGCGWRNIQILCSFLLAESPESREVLFNGAGFVPDISALQLWLEIAWRNGFDEPGGKYFNWSIAGTRKWIGTTECAALLRSFGVRAKIVSFTALGGKRVRNKTEHKVGSYIDVSDGEGNQTSDVLTEGVKKSAGQTGSTSSRGGARSLSETESANSHGGTLNCDKCGKSCEQGTRYRGIVEKDSNMCNACMETASQSGGSGEARDFTAKKHDGNDSRLDPNTPDISPRRHIKSPTRDSGYIWNLDCDGCGEPLRGRRYMTLMRRNFDICAKCMKGIEDNPQERGSTENFFVVEEFPASRCTGPPVEDEEGKDGFDILHEDAEKEKDHEREMGNRESKDAKNANDEQTGRERGEADARGIGNEKYQKTPNLDARTSARQKSAGTSTGHEPIANEERGKAGMRGTPSGTCDIDHHHLIEWVWSYFTDDSSRRFSGRSTNSREIVTMSRRSPLYFQHRGHSRTIVGIERRKKPEGISEDVYLLVLDPSLSTELLVKSLREKSGWNELIKNDVHTLKEAEYQLCYADPGIATGEEMEQLKILSSLRYSYY